MRPTTKLLLVSSLMLALQACTTTGTENSTDIIKPIDTIKPIETIKPTGLIVPLPMSVVSEVTYIITKKIPVTTMIDGESKEPEELEVSLLDEFMSDVMPNTRHYPPNFPNNTQRYNTRQNIKAFEKILMPYADAPNASYEVLIRAAQLSGMARNLDMGSNYTVSGSNYVSRALKLKPDDIEANLLYGIMLSEGGAFKTGRKYLDKSVELGSVEAEQSIAQADLLSDNISDALNRLKNLQQAHPNDPLLPIQIATVENGKYYLWDIPAPNVNVKPVS